MTTLKLATGEWLSFQVPEGATDISINTDTLAFAINNEEDDFEASYITLPPGSYSLPFPCVVGEMTEEQAKTLVGSMEQVQLEGPPKMTYRNYVKEGEFEHASILHNYPHDTATASLLSLCRANGLNPSTTILLKVNN